MNDHLSIARQAMSAPWDAARSDRVFRAAVRARDSRARRQRWAMALASAAVFILAVHTLAGRAASMRTYASDAPSNGASVEDDLGTQSAGAVAMGAVADGGRETD